MLDGANRPLAGIVVLDFGQVYQGPYATLQLLDLTRELAAFNLPARVGQLFGVSL
jgi:crotonobetainyl-CoA:carnitine CoA-transferase CaiB-like acyl-CoA transferase